MPRIQGLDDSITFSGDLAVKPGVKTTLFSITISWSGATAGDRVNLRNGSDGAAPFRVPIVFDAAAGTLHFEWLQGKEFDLGMFIDTQGNGQVNGCITFK